MLKADKSRTARSVMAVMAALASFAAALQAQVDRTHPPELGPAPSLKLPPIHDLRLSNGLRVVLMEKHDVPLVQVNLIVRTGSVNDPKERLGLATLTADMLDEGAGTRDALELSDAVDFLGARISTGAGLHTTRVSLHTPLSKFDDALPLMADIVLRPTFPEQELNRKRLSYLTTLMQWHDEARVIAREAFSQALYGRDHPYGRSTFGTERSLHDVTVADLKAFHGKYFKPNNGTLIVVGDVTPADVMPRLEKAFGGWKPGDVPRVEVPAAEQVGDRTVYLVDKPGAAQSEIRIGRVGARRRTQDFFALTVMNTILGGSFTSRLNQNLREEHGYSYGAFSSFSFRPERGPFIASAAVQTDVTDKALVEFINELRRILEPVPEEELSRAKNFVALRFPGSFQAVSNIANQLAQLVVFDLPLSYFNEYIEHVLAVNGSDVLRAARKYIDPTRVAIVIVGDRKVIEPGVRALNLGVIKSLTIDDVLGKAPKPTG